MRVVEPGSSNAEAKGLLWGEELPIVELYDGSLTITDRER